MLAAALIPPLAMGLFIWVLTLSVGRQPVALVVDDHGPQATIMANIFTSDQEAYALKETDPSTAEKMLASQQVAAVIVIPPTFDGDVARGTATVDLTLNNVDIDFGDDIRRAVARSVAQFDAPFLGFGGELAQGGLHAVVPNPYRVAIAETTLRKTNVGFLAYEIAPVMLLVVLSVGTLGIGWLMATDIGSGALSFLRTTPASSLGIASGRMVAALCVIAVVPVSSLAGAAPRATTTPPGPSQPPLASCNARSSLPPEKALFSISGRCHVGTEVPLNATLGWRRLRRRLCLEDNERGHRLFFAGD